MKKTIFITVALFAFTSFTSQLFAQDAPSKTSGYDLKKAVKCRVTSTDGGCYIEFEHDVKSPRDAASGQASGRRGYDYYKAQSAFSINASDNSIAEVKNPRDAASGLATGKRMHKPFVVTKELDKSSPKLAEAVVKGKSSSDSSSSEIAIDEPGVQSKVSVQDFHFTVRCGGKTTQVSCADGECEIPTNCPDGTCSAIASWSWGATNSGSSSVGTTGSGMGRCSVEFLLEIEDGVCARMAINEKGLPGDKGNKGTTKK